MFLIKFWTIVNERGIKDFGPFTGFFELLLLCCLEYLQTQMRVANYYAAPPRIEIVLDSIGFSFYLFYIHEISKLYYWKSDASTNFLTSFIDWHAKKVVVCFVPFAKGYLALTTLVIFICNLIKRNINVNIT